MASLKTAQKLAIAGLGFALSALLLSLAASGVDRGRLQLAVPALGAASLAFAAGLLATTARTLSRTLARVILAAREVAAGRLDRAELRLAGGGEREASRPGPAGDDLAELVEAFRTMIVTLSSPIEQLRHSGADVGGASAQMAASVKELEAAVVEQAASTNQVTATSKQIFATVQELAGTMRAVRQMASQAASLAGAGLESLNGINATMTELLEATAGISSILTAISERAAAITQVITAITNIANRTNLISLNAAIEAEKAGERAAGFSVVAVEIRRLADQTAVAALDIEKMIGEMQTAVQNGVASISHYAGRARASSATVAGITTDLTRVIEYTRQLEPHFESVNSGMQMQSRAAGQILEAMQQLAETAGRTRDSLAQFRQVADHMRAAAQVLESEVGRFAVAV